MVKVLMHFCLEGVVVVISIIAKITHLENVGIKLSGNVLVKTSQRRQLETILLFPTTAATGENRTSLTALAVTELYAGYGHAVVDRLHDQILKGWLAQIVISSGVAIREDMGAFVAHVRDFKVEV